MTITIHTHAFGATRSFNRPDAGELSVDFQRMLPSGRAIEGAATLTRNDDGSVNVQVTRTGPNGRTAERSTTVPSEQVDAFKERVREFIADRRDGPDATT